MSIVQGYSSSEDEDHIVDNIPKLPVYQLKTYADINEENEHSKTVTVENNKQAVLGGSIEKAYVDDLNQGSPNVTSKRSKELQKSLKRKRKKVAKDVDDYDSVIDPWAEYEESSDNEPQHKHNNGNEIVLEEKEEEVTIEPYESDKEESTQIHTEFVGSSEFDYLGRTYMHIPRDLDINLMKESGSQECFVPKVIMHKFEGHAKGVTKLEFFPKSGHLLLSAGNDGRIKLWDMYHKRELLRVYYGHSRSVKDVSFNNKGDEFLSCGFDKQIRLWNTETGDIKKTIKVNAIPNAIKFNPNNENEFIVGLSNNKIEHYDLSAIHYQTPVQSYDHHLGSINSLTIVDDGNRFMSTADDKTVRFWDWQVNIPVKFISDPSQQAMNSPVVYPGGSYIALQSMDNSIRVIQGHGKYKFNKKKVFTSHHSAGFAIGIDISPDGKIILSGDSKGSAYFWDWKTCKLINKIKLGNNNKPINCIKFHPQEKSKVVMAGVSGEIYYGD
ncbi:WD40-repeat-containing domain protein [Scheffersomyces coipomensis]|uniref:WD40-repeat-containing domain protein n=1 Tax=Scheffersomyces coipomensis TaxID=1788519 RepID=UPI00315D1D2D